MPDALTWVVLPHGLSEDKSSLLLSLTASPAVTSPSGRLADCPLADWPRLLRPALDGLVLRVAGKPTKHRLTVVGSVPDSDVWRRVFPGTAPVGVPPGGATMRLPQIGGGIAYDRAHAAAADLYAAALQNDPTEMIRRESAVGRAIVALGRLTAATEGDVMARAVVPEPVLRALDPGTTTRARLDDAVRALRTAGRVDEAAVAPLVPLVVGQRRAARESVASVGIDPQTPGPLPDLDDTVPGFEQADVHQVWGVLSEHPMLARRLGIVVDLAVAVSPDLVGEASVRVERADGRLPLAETFAEVRHPFSRVQFLPHAGTFLMVPNPGGEHEITSGMLDLSPDPADDAYVVGDLDIRSIARQLQLTADSAVRRDTVPELSETQVERAVPRGIGARRAPGVETARGPGAPAASAPLNGGAADLVLPVRRDPGFVVAQARRVERALAPSLALSDRMAGASADQAVLFADDVTAGYRVDVSRNGGAYQSLMKRVARYAVAGLAKTEPIVAHDEGTVEGLVAVAEELESGPSLSIGEEVFGWEGWSLGAGLPGPSVIADAAGAPSTGTVGTETLAGYGLAVAIEPEPGTLPVLRFGDTYSFAARATDLAGNSLPPGTGSAAAASPPVMFRRHEPVPPPRLVPRRAFHPAETLTRLVVRSDGFGNLLDGTVERHLVPPPVAQRTAERHGLFDAAFGPDTPERKAARRALLAVASRESGALTDPRVSDGRGGLVPAEGIAVVAPNGNPGTLPLQPGEPLPPGQYVIHDTERLRVPDLPDPGASGILLTIPFAGPEGWWATYGSAAWPEAKPIRLVVRAVTGAPAGEISVRTTANGDVVDVPLNPGAQYDMVLASSIPPSVVDVMDPLSTSSLRNLAIAGFIVAFSPRQPISFVHATRAPAADPLLVLDVDRDRGLGDSLVRVDARMSAHRETTARVDAFARWIETTDTGVGPLLVQPRSVVLTSFGVDPSGPAEEDVRIEYDFGDTKHRDLGVSAVGATRFRDCFPDLEPGDPAMLRTGSEGQLQVLNSRVPEPPVVHSLIPTFRWERSFVNGVYSSRRVANGVRVFLKRPWLTTGDGERLGVVTYAKEIDNTNAAGALGNPNDDHPYANVVSRWGMDPVELRTPLTPPLTAASFGPSGGTPISPRGVPVPQGVTPVNVQAVTFAVQFDAERNLWFADVPVDRTMHNQPYFLRLGLVRFQPASVAGAKESKVVQTDWIAMPSTQAVTVRVTGPEQVEVEVFDALLGNRRYTAGLEMRPVVPGASRADDSDITVEGISPVELTKVVATASRLVARGTVRNDPNGVDHAHYRRGRLVVREEQTGEDVRFPGGAKRVVFFETVDWTTFFPV